MLRRRQGERLPPRAGRASDASLHRAYASHIHTQRFLGAARGEEGGALSVVVWLRYYCVQANAAQSLTKPRKGVRLESKHIVRNKDGIPMAR